MDRRTLLLGLGASLGGPAFARDDRPCDPPRYLGWTGRREARWPDRIGEAGFVNYYGEPYRFDAALNVPRDHLPSCNVFGATASTLARPGRVRDHLADLTVAGTPRSTDCTLWPGETLADFEEKVARLRADLAAQGADGVRFHPVGSHHSSSDVYRRVDDNPAVVVRIDGLNAVALDRPEWKPAFVEASGDEAFAFVGGGIEICQLNEALWELGLALQTQGSFDGQTLAGAIATGTHGAGATHGAVADGVEAVVLVTRLHGGAWEVLQIEPDAEHAITDPTLFRTDRAGVRWRLVQNTELFESAIVSMGMLGVIVGFVMRVRRAYFLHEIRVGRPWSEIRNTFVARALGPPSGFAPDGWRYELAVNPESVVGGKDWVCTEVYRNAWTYDLDYLSEVRQIPQKWVGSLTRNINLGGQLGKLIAAQANRSLTRGKRVGAFADRCYRVLKLGQGEFVQAWGTELMVPESRAVDLIDWVLRTNAERGKLGFGTRRGNRLLNPFGVRFARGSRGYLSMVRWQRGSGVVCTAELTEAVKDNDVRNLGPRADKPCSKAIVEAWAEDFVRTFGSDGRLHFGQVQGNTGRAELEAAYPAEELAAFGDAFATLNPFGHFDTAFAKRMGFIARRDSGTALSRFRGLF